MLYHMLTLLGRGWFEFDGNEVEGLKRRLRQERKETRFVEHAFAYFVGRGMRAAFGVGKTTTTTTTTTTTSIAATETHTRLVIVPQCCMPFSFVYSVCCGCVFADC